MTGKLRFLFFLVFAVPLVSAGSQYNHENVVGEWIQHSRNESGDLGYYYLKIEPDFSGLFSYKFYGSEPVLIPFSEKDLSFEDGFLVFDDREYRRLVFSAYREGLLTGVMWFYQEIKGFEELFNSFFLRLVTVPKENIEPEVMSIRSTVDRLSK